MAHEVETMTYRGEVPWHGLGYPLTDEEATSWEEVRRRAGLNWRVRVTPAYAYMTGLRDPVTGKPLAPKMARAEDQFLVVRESDFRVLGGVKGRYVPVQNEDAFRFIEEIAGPGRDVQYETAGALKGGRVVFLLARLRGSSIAPVPDDETHPYLLLANNHDGRGLLRCLFTTTRVVCQNTLNVALRASGEGVAIRHTRNVLDRVEEAQRILGLARREFDLFGELARRLAGNPMSANDWTAFLDVVVPLPRDRHAGKALSNRAELTRLFEEGPGTDLPGVRGTRWGALQAVTAYTTHHRTTRGDGDLQAENRLHSVWFGSGNDLNQRALRALQYPDIAAA